MAVIGAILGDIAGSQYEFNRPKDLDYHNCELFTDKCVFTDDTVMTLAAKLAVRNHIPFADSYREFGDKYPHAGYGGKFRMWLRYELRKWLCHEMFLYRGTLQLGKRSGRMGR